MAATGTRGVTGASSTADEAASGGGPGDGAGRGGGSDSFSARGLWTLGRSACRAFHAAVRFPVDVGGPVSSATDDAGNDGRIGAPVTGRAGRGDPVGGLSSTAPGTGAPVRGRTPTGALADAGPLPLASTAARPSSVARGRDWRPGPVGGRSSNAGAGAGVSAAATVLLPLRESDAATLSGPGAPRTPAPAPPEDGRSRPFAGPTTPSTYARIACVCS